MQMRRWFSILAACSLAVSLTLFAPVDGVAQDNGEVCDGTAAPACVRMNR